MIAANTVLRVLAGGLSVLFGLYLGGLNVTETEADWRITVLSVGVVLGGTILIARARRRSPVSRTARIAGTAVSVAGLLAGLVAPLQEQCCDAVWMVGLGLPLAGTTGYGDTWPQAFHNALTSHWDLIAVLLNAIFWAYAGMIVALSVRPRRVASRAV